MTTTSDHVRDNGLPLTDVECPSRPSTRRWQPRQAGSCSAVMSHRRSGTARNPCRPETRRGRGARLSCVESSSDSSERLALDSLSTNFKAV
jgi:hypothetical protein